jgi:serine/threonine protein phosphatase 1
MDQGSARLSGDREAHLEKPAFRLSCSSLKTTEVRLAVYAIGDIHGNLAALDDLLAQVLREATSGDAVVFLGDYIDRGPDVRQCVDRIIRLKNEERTRVVTLMGNHEQWLLRSFKDHTKHSWILGMEAFDTIASYSTKVASLLREEVGRVGSALFTGQVRLPYERFFDLLPSSHLQFFQELNTFYRSSNVVCVHGGLDPSAGPVESQEVEALIWGTDDFPDGYRGADKIVYGHWGNAILDQQGWPRPRCGDNRTYGIDTISHGVLTAIRFPDEKLFQSDRYRTSS